MLPPAAKHYIGRPAERRGAQNKPLPFSDSISQMQINSNLNLKLIYSIFLGSTLRPKAMYLKRVANCAVELVMWQARRG